MRYKLVKLNKYSGKSASLYTIFLEDEQKTLFDLFLAENKNTFISELKSIVSGLNDVWLIVKSHSPETIWILRVI